LGDRSAHIVSAHIVQRITIFTISKGTTIGFSLPLIAPEFRFFLFG